MSDPPGLGLGDGVWRSARLVPATASPTFFPGGFAASSRTKKAGFGPSSAVAAASRCGAAVPRPIDCHRGRTRAAFDPI